MTTLVNILLYMQTFESPQSGDSVLERPLGLWLERKPALVFVYCSFLLGFYRCVCDVCLCVSCMRLIFIKIQFPREGGGEGET